VLYDEKAPCCDGERSNSGCGTHLIAEMGLTVEEFREHLAKKGEERVEHISVSSSNIASVGYDIATCTLQIKFHSGGLYEYYDVPYAVYQGLMNASSHGKYFHQYIKNVYPYKRLR
jgi:hypothetical protein